MPSKKKIVFVQSYELFPDFRVYRELLLLCPEYECHVIVWQRTENQDYIGTFPGVFVHPVKLVAPHGMGALGHLKFQPLFCAKVVKLLRHLRPDLVVGHNFDGALPAVIHRISSRCPVLYVSREPYHVIFRMKLKSILGQWAGWLLDLCVAHLSSKVVAVTPAMISMFKGMNIDAAWIPNAPTEAFFIDKAVRPADEVVVGFVGNIRSDMGIEETWQAIKILNDTTSTRYKLLVCGVPLQDYSAKLLAMKQERPEALVIKGPIPSEEVPNLYQEIDLVAVLVKPNVKFRKYGVHVKIYEALATQTPVVMSSVGENVDFLGDVGCYMVVDYSDVNEIVSVVGELGRNRIKRLAMGEAGREFVSRHYRWSLFSNKYQELVRGLLGES